MNETFSCGTFRCELLLARNDNTWDTKVFDLPLSLDEAPDSEIEYWWSEEFGTQKQYADVVAVKVYNINPEVE